MKQRDVLGEAPAVAVITGVGCVSPFGVGGHEMVAKALAANTSAIQPITSFSTVGLPSCLGAEVPAAALPLTEEARRWSRLSHMTVVACRYAAAEAGLLGTEAMHTMGLVVGTEFGDLRSTEAFGLGFLRKGPVGLSPLLFPNTVMNAMAGTVSVALGIKGPMLTLNQTGIAGEVAVARAIALIQAERAPAVLACGVDEIFPLLYETLVRGHIPSPQDGKEEACRPFDRRHNGPVLGEGATAIMLESPASARARDATILAEVRGVRWGGRPVRPQRYPASGQLSRRVLDGVVADTRLTPHAVEVAYLSGAGMPQHDEAELALLAATFGAPGPIVTSVTHLAGEYGGLGTFRVAAATIAITQGIVPLLPYLCQPIRTDIRFATQRVAPPPMCVLVHGLARGGMQTALLIGRPQHE